MLRFSSCWRKIHLLVLAVLFWAGPGCDASNSVTDSCTGWNSPRFFAYATDAKIAACVEQGSWEHRDPKWGNAPIHAAASGGSVLGLRMLLARGADANAVGHREATPLVYAIRVASSTQAVSILLEGGADPNRADWRGVWPLHMAATQDSHDIMEALLKGGASPLVASLGDGMNALHHLLLRNVNPSIASIRLLVSNGLDPNARTASGETALHFLSTHQNATVVTELLDWGADAEAANAIGMRPLHSAAFGRSKAIVAALLRAGADVDAVDARGRTALHYASSSPFVCSAGIVETLLKAGANDAMRDAGNQTPAELRAHWTEDREATIVAAHGRSVLEADCPLAR